MVLGIKYKVLSMLIDSYQVSVEDYFPDLQRKEMARFEVKMAVKITGRELLFLAGNFIDGEIKIGDYILFHYETGDHQKQIIALEFMDFNISDLENLYYYVCLGVEDRERAFDPKKVPKQQVVTINQPI